MIDEGKAKEMFNKAEDFINENADKAIDFAKEHGLDKKAEDIAQKVEDGATGVFNTIKDKIGGKEN